MKFIWLREREYSGSGLALQTHFVPSADPKCHLGDVEETIFQRDEWPWKVIFCLLTSSNYKFEGSKSLNLRVIISLRYIFLLLIKMNNDLGDVLKAFSSSLLFRVSHRLENSFLRKLSTEIATSTRSIKWFLKETTGSEQSFLPSHKLKIQTQRGLIIDNLRVRLTLRYNFLPLVKMTNNLGRDEKLMFQGVRGLCKIVSCFLPSQKFDLVEVEKAMFKVIS
jgi:hypothetical protein